jgi:hypothetical protein
MFLQGGPVAIRSIDKRYGNMPTPKRAIAQTQGFEGFTLANNVESESVVDVVVALAVEGGGTQIKGPQTIF